MNSIVSAVSAPLASVRIHLNGRVQGSGYRPFLYRLAEDCKLSGKIYNTRCGVAAEIEGSQENVNEFLSLVEEKQPPGIQLREIFPEHLPSQGFSSLAITESLEDGKSSISAPPDTACCSQCLSECLEPTNRRFRYPFISCAQCGPRLSIITALPYDRKHTTFSKFSMCPQCLAEYQDCRDRRFHAQTISCSDCGPELILRNTCGKTIANGDAALQQTQAALAEGRIIALKSMGGYQLIAAANDSEAIELLRARKQRPTKPFALMIAEVKEIERLCLLDQAEKEALLSAQAPITLLRVRDSAELPAGVAPGLSTLGAMLPYTAIHHLLLADLPFPIIATSGNISDEPICIAEDEAVKRLGSICDLFLSHNLQIARPVDDSVVHLIQDSVSVIRASRGFAPVSINIEKSTRNSVGCGAQQKNAIAVCRNGEIVLSQQIGDLSSAKAAHLFERSTVDYCRLSKLEIDSSACDLHPDYHSTRWAKSQAASSVGVQHHHAHVLSCVAENNCPLPVLGVCWDGSGFGTDGTLWGGEFLIVDEGGFRRSAHLRTFALPGGEQSIKEPRRSAIGLLYEMLGGETFARSDLDCLLGFSQSELGVLQQMLEQRVNCPRTSSIGRLFDAVASLVGICQRSSFEGEAAMLLENIAEVCPGNSGSIYTRSASPLESTIIDWAPFVKQLLEQSAAGISSSIIAGSFHLYLARLVAEMAEQCGLPRVVLTGGCFQNRLLLELTIDLLETRGYCAFWHKRVPTNDSGIAVGQVYAAAGRSMEVS